MSYTKYSVLAFAVFTVLFTGISMSNAQDDIQEPPAEVPAPKVESKEKTGPCDGKVEKASTGTVATVGRYGSSGVALDTDTAGATAGDAPTSVTGSIQYKSDTKCEAVISNSSECFKYSVSFEVNSSKSTVTSSSVSLLPGSSKSVSFSCKRDESYSLKITKSTSSKATSK